MLKFHNRSVMYQNFIFFYYSGYVVLWLYIYGLSVLTTALVKHCCLGKLQVYIFCRKVVEIHEQDFKKIFSQCWKNFSYFGKIAHLNLLESVEMSRASHFPVKIGRYSLKNRKIFLKKLYIFPAIFQENFTYF